MRKAMEQRYQRRAAATLFGRACRSYSADMKNSRIAAFVLSLVFLPGCATVETAWRDATSAGVVRTFNMPVARVKPAFVSTLNQMGMPIAAIEVRGKNEVVKARRADRSAEIEFERLGASSTRVRVSGSDDAQIMREAEKRLTAG
jgi:hypothetical protein